MSRTSAEPAHPVIEQRVREHVAEAEVAAAQEAGVILQGLELRWSENLSSLTLGG